MIGSLHFTFPHIKPNCCKVFNYGLWSLEGALGHRFWWSWLADVINYHVKTPQIVHVHLNQSELDWFSQRPISAHLTSALNVQKIKSFIFHGGWELKTAVPGLGNEAHLLHSPLTVPAHQESEDQMRVEAVLAGWRHPSFCILPVLHLYILQSGVVHHHKALLTGNKHFLSNYLWIWHVMSIVNWHLEKKLTLFSWSE